MGSDPQRQGQEAEPQSFNSRSRMGSDPSPATPASPAPSFNSCSRMGSDPKNPRRIAPRRVSIHAPAWGATKKAKSHRAYQRFQFTLPHGERRNVRDGVGVRYCFNSRSRMGSDVAAARRPAARRSFNSRSRMGSDGRARRRRPHLAGFNSRSRMGSDVNRYTLGLLLQVSIHAPAWGATWVRIPPPAP